MQTNAAVRAKTQDNKDQLRPIAIYHCELKTTRGEEIAQHETGNEKHFCFQVREREKK